MIRGTFQMRIYRYSKKNNTETLKTLKAGLNFNRYNFEHLSANRKRLKKFGPGVTVINCFMKSIILNDVNRHKKFILNILNYKFSNLPQGVTP